MLSLAQLKKLFPRARLPHLQAFADQHQALFDEFGISGSRNRLHFFLAQIGHESGGLTIAEENLNYSAPRMMAVWPSRFRTLAAAEAFAHNPEKLANLVYCDRMGNGPTAGGDGWRYRGRGYAQITGREGYQSVGSVAGLDLLAEPDQVSDPAHALRVVCAFWAWKKLNPLADRGDFIALTRRWNGGTIGMSDRLDWLQRVQQIVPWRELAPELEARRISLDTVKHVQRTLQQAGLYDGSIDGIIGRLTRAALRAWQADRGLAPVGEITAETLASMPAIDSSASAPARVPPRPGLSSTVMAPLPP